MKEKYHIYNYFKNHEGALIALVSGIAGFIIMALNFVLYTADRFYLSTWDCSIIPIENSPSRFYSLCIWFSFFIAYMLLGKILGKVSFDSQKDAVKLNHYLINLKNNKKELKKCEKILKNEKRPVNEEINFQDISNKIDSLKSQIRSLNKEVINAKNEVQLKSILKILTISAASLIPITLIKYIQTLEFIQSLKSTLDTIILLLIFLIPLSILVINIASKKISIKSKDSKSLSNDFLSDSMIIRNCKKAVFNFIFVVILIYLSSWGKSLSNKEFEVFSIENQEYASIYESEHYLIGKKIIYNDSAITFYMNNQIIVEKTNLTIMKKKFEKVETVNANKSVNLE